jgi:2-desacetyl-2-hydroxyethyl bacteriochlorophyllide A dehydrogenase
MKAGVKYDSGPGHFAFRDVDIPCTGDDEVLIKIQCAAVCGVDALLYDWTYKGRYPVKTPVVPGHECAGVITDTGKNVRGLAVGDRVTVESIIGCGHCYYCRNGMSNLCPQWDHVGITFDGTFAEFMKISASAVHRLPDAVSAPQGALVEPLALTVHTFDRIKLFLGDTVAIIGPGVQGLLHAQVARAYGAAQVIVLGLAKDRKRLDMAEASGADAIIVSDQGDPVAEVLAMTHGIGADVVIEVGGTPESFRLALDIVRGGGQVAALGFSNYGELVPIRLARQQLTIAGVIAFLPKHFESAIQWIETGKVDVEAVVSHRLDLESAEEGIKLMRDKVATKVLLTP